jgi:hypothetical protein
MKKILVLATAAFLFTGVAFAQTKDKDQKKTEGKSCCKKDANGKESCKKDGKDCCSKDKKEAKEVAKTKA